MKRGFQTWDTRQLMTGNAEHCEAQEVSTVVASRRLGFFLS